MTTAINQGGDGGRIAASGDRAGRPADQAAARLGDTATIPCAVHTPLPWGISHGYSLSRIEIGADYVCGQNPHTIGIKIATPWIEGAWDDDPEARANAAFIVRACNSHYDLLEALERIARGVDGASAAKIARRAIAKARGQS